MEMLRAWSHGAYGLLQSLWISRAVHLGNTRRLQRNVEELCQAIPSNLGFASSVPIYPATPNSIGIDSWTEQRVVDLTTRYTVELLILSLVVVFDEIAAELLEKGGHKSQKMPGDKAGWLRKNLPDRTRWAALGVTELVAIRNALVHGQGTWNERAIKMLRAAEVTPLPGVGVTVRPGVDDLFRYRRAVRTALNEMKKI